MLKDTTSFNSNAKRRAYLGSIGLLEIGSLLSTPRLRVHQALVREAFCHVVPAAGAARRQSIAVPASPLPPPRPRLGANRTMTTGPSAASQYPTSPLPRHGHCGRMRTRKSSLLLLNAAKHSSCCNSRALQQKVLLLSPLFSL